LLIGFDFTILMKASVYFPLFYLSGSIAMPGDLSLDDALDLKTVLVAEIASLPLYTRQLSTAEIRCMVMEKGWISVLYFATWCLF